MGEKQAPDAAAAVHDDGQAGVAAAALDGIQYCSEHPYRPGSAAAAAAVAGGGICAFCLQEKLGRLVSSSKSSPFFPLGGHPPPSGSPSSPPSFRRAAEPPPPLHPSAASRKFMSFHRKKTPSSSSSSSSSASAALSAGGSGLKRSKSVAPRPEEQFPYSSASSLAAESPRKKSFWSFLYLSSGSTYAQQAAAASAPYAASGGAAAARRKSVSVPSAAWAPRANAGGQDQQPRAGTAAASTLGRTLEAIGEPESPSQSQVSSSSSFGRKVARSRSVGCGSRSFSGDFLERISNGFGDCTLRRVESHREPKPHKMRGGGGGALGHLGGGGGVDDDDEDDDVYEHQHRIKCAGFFGGVGPASSSYWLSAAEGAAGGVGSGTRKSGGRSHRSWAWALASPMRALRPTPSATSTKTISNGGGIRPPKPKKHRAQRFGEPKPPPTGDPITLRKMRAGPSDTQKCLTLSPRSIPPQRDGAKKAGRSAGEVASAPPVEVRARPARRAALPDRAAAARLGGAPYPFRAGVEGRGGATGWLARRGGAGADGRVAWRGAPSPTTSSSTSPPSMAAAPMASSPAAFHLHHAAGVRARPPPGALPLLGLR